LILSAGIEIHFLSICDVLKPNHSFTDILRVGVEIDRANAESVLKSDRIGAAFRRWFARYEGQTENDSHDTGSDAPAAALGMAILLMEENDAVSDRLWGN